MDDLISRQAAIDALERDIKFVEEEREKAITRPEKYHDRFVEASTQQIMGMAHALQAIEELPSAQPEKRTEERTETHACDCVSETSVCEILADIYPTDGEKVVAVKEVDKAYEAIQQLPSAQPEPQWIP